MYSPCSDVICNIHTTKLENGCATNPNPPKTIRTTPSLITSLFTIMQVSPPFFVLARPQGRAIENFSNYFINPLIIDAGTPMIRARAKIPFAKANLSSASSAVLIIPLEVWYVDWKFLLLVCSAIWSGTLQIAEIAGARASVVMVATKSPMMIARNLIIYVVISRYKLGLLINRSFSIFGGEIYEKY